MPLHLSSATYASHGPSTHDVEAAAALYHPEASIMQVDDVHGGTEIARGAAGIRATMAAYIGLKPHMDMVTHHVTQSGDSP